MGFGWVYIDSKTIFGVIRQFTDNKILRKKFISFSEVAIHQRTKFMWMKTSRLRVLTTKWIGEGWVKLMENPNLMRSAFSRTGLSLPLNGSRDSEIRFDGEGVDPITVDSDDESDSDENDAENSV